MITTLIEHGVGVWLKDVRGWAIGLKAQDTPNALTFRFDQYFYSLLTFNTILDLWTAKPAIVEQL